MRGGAAAGKVRESVAALCKVLFIDFVLVVAVVVVRRDPRPAAPEPLPESLQFQFDVVSHSNF